jgi:hypothetical protein
MKRNGLPAGQPFFPDPQKIAGEAQHFDKERVSTVDGRQKL